MPMSKPFSSSPLLRAAVLGLAVATLGAGCAKQEPKAPPEPPKQPAAPAAPPAAGLLPKDQVTDVDPDFTAGSEYMRETPERYADLNGKKPYLLNFYADWNKDERTEHEALVKLFDGKKFGTPLLRVNFKDNQVTDEGVAWAKALNVTSERTTIAFTASGKEAARFTGPLDEAKLSELMAKANGK